MKEKKSYEYEEKETSYYLISLVERLTNVLNTINKIDNNDLYQVYSDLIIAVKETNLLKQKLLDILNTLDKMDEAHVKHTILFFVVSVIKGIKLSKKHLPLIKAGFPEYFDQFNDEILKSEWNEQWKECEANHLLWFPEFKDKIQQFIETL